MGKKGPKSSLSLGKKESLCLQKRKANLIEQPNHNPPFETLDPKKVYSPILAWLATLFLNSGCTQCCSIGLLKNEAYGIAELGIA